ncbi:unnamed protein product [Cuscuta europaea]|uniref:LOB domain-containing protein n=1 Tax=Cuscuta europaea TaxID=41803 RepID=A0A9P1A125_CUSEU|nr:unnamed protein product [Cuscuta europaea]
MSCGGGSGGGGPCGACKYLRRKCVSGCVFAPYFESDQLGTAHFAAVHKVFGASNASKMLMAIPDNRRLEAVVTLCYEALARVRDPVYGCVAHIFTLQHQVVNLQAELAYVQARLSALRHQQRRLPERSCEMSLGAAGKGLKLDPAASLEVVVPHNSAAAAAGGDVSLPCIALDHTPIAISSDTAAATTRSVGGGGGGHSHNEQQQLQVTSDLHMLAWEFVSKHLPAAGVTFRPSQ